MKSLYSSIDRVYHSRTMSPGIHEDKNRRRNGYMKAFDKLVNCSSNPTELPGQRACSSFILPLTKFLDYSEEEREWKLEFLGSLVISQDLYSSFGMYYPKLL